MSQIFGSPLNDADIVSRSNSAIDFFEHQSWMKQQVLDHSNISRWYEIVYIHIHADAESIVVDALGDGYDRMSIDGDDSIRIQEHLANTDVWQIIRELRAMNDDLSAKVEAAAAAANAQRIADREAKAAAKQAEANRKRQERRSQSR